MRLGCPRGQIHRLAIGIAWSLVAAGCQDGLLVGAEKVLGAGGSPQGAGGTTSLPGTGGAAAKLEIVGAPPTPPGVTVGAAEDLAVLSLQNVGEATATNVQLSLSPLPTPFSLESDGCSGQPLSPGATCLFQLAVTPATPGALGVNVVAAAAEGSVGATVLVTAAGLEAAMDDPGPLSAAVGCSSARAVVRVTNKGHRPSTLSSLLFSAGLHHSAGDTCVAGKSLAPDEQCLTSLTASPASVGPGSEFVTVSGSPGGDAQVTLATFGLDDYLVAPRALSLISTNGKPATGLITVSVGGKDRAGFDLSGPVQSVFTRTTTCKTPLSACSSCQVMVTFSPMATMTFPTPGTFTDSLTIYSAGLATIVDLTGTTMPTP